MDWGELNINTDASRVENPASKTMALLSWTPKEKGMILFNMKNRFLASLLFAGSLVFAGCTIHAEMPKVGATAPVFQGQNQDGQMFKLSDLIGKKNVLLYFYPKDETSGCTKEACGLRDRMGELQTNNVAVVGVSHDSVTSHKKFAEKYHLNFTLIADPKDKIINLYDVKMPMLGMAKRVSFLINLDGKIVHVTDSMNPQVHFDEMKKAIAELKKH